MSEEKVFYSLQSHQNIITSSLKTLLNEYFYILDLHVPKYTVHDYSPSSLHAFHFKNL